MIASIWASAVSAMQNLGWLIDPSETDQLSDMRYTIVLPSVERDIDASTVACARVIRDLRIRLQYRDRKDAYLQKTIAEDVQSIVIALRGTDFLFEDATVQTRPGGYISEIRFSVRDRWSADEPA